MDEKSIENGLEGQKFLVVCLFWGGCHHPNVWDHEIANIQNRVSPTLVQGTDHGTGHKYISGPVYGNYAIYVSKDASSFPGPGHVLDIEVDVVPKYKFF